MRTLSTRTFRVISGWRALGWTIAGAALLYAAAALPMRVIASRQITGPVFLRGQPNTSTLVVAVHGLNGTRSRNGLLAMAKKEFSGADVIAPLYFDGPLGALSNADPYSLTDALEVEINRRFESHHYEHIILIGHSMGASLLRKALVWARGEEGDRALSRGTRAWVSKAERFVSLAGINRGWTTEPRPKKMPLFLSWLINAGEFAGKITGTGEFALALRRGSPFVADLRVQWMRVARRAEQGFPDSIHILGTEDDIVNSDDSRDLCAAPGVKFVTLPNTGHSDIATAVAQDDGSERSETIRRAIAGRLTAADFDADPGECHQIRGVKRVVFIVHGIRDYAEWGETLQQRIEAAARERGVSLAVEPAKYGFFPMAPFLLRFDRQKKVRWFMDQYTDTLATYPDVQDVDFIGHSNGTYMLGAALLRYHAIRFRDAYIAGSVLPQRFPWGKFVPMRVRSVRNIVAADDWVVAIFPRLFEQIAEWVGADSVDGFLDLGAAGFRGFLNQARGAVRDIRYADGSHGVGVDVSKQRSREALLLFALDGVSAPVDEALDNAFRRVAKPSTLVDWLSRLSWLIWAVLAAAVISFGTLLYRVRWWAGATFALLLLALLNSI